MFLFNSVLLVSSHFTVSGTAAPAQACRAFFLRLMPVDAYSMYDVFSLRYLVALWGQKIIENITCSSKAACKFSKILLFSLWDLARKMRLVKRFRLLGSNREKVHWVSSCGRFIARKKFRSQCHITFRESILSRPPGAKINGKRNLLIQGRMQIFENIAF